LELIKLIFSASFTIGIFASCAQNNNEYRQQDYEVKIFEKLPFGQQNCFTPSGEQIKKGEDNIKNNLDKVLSLETDTSEYTVYYKKMIRQDFNKYNRRYFGYTNGLNEPILLVEFVHKDFFKDDAWKSAKWSVDGGGYVFWSIEFNLQKHSFDKLWINAPM
jgi:hypothetical protein